MSATTQLLDRARETHRLTSDNKLAQFLGWYQETISAYRRGRNVMDVEQVAEFSQKTGIPLDEVLAAAVIDKKAQKSKRRGQMPLDLQAA